MGRLLLVTIGAPTFVRESPVTHVVWSVVVACARHDAGNSTRAQQLGGSYEGIRSAPQDLHKGRAANRRKEPMFANHTTRVGIVLGLAAVVGASEACSVTATTDAPGSGTGALEVVWDVASSKDPTACTTYGAVSIVVQLLDSVGNSYGSSYTQTCSSFTLSVPSLPTATYGVIGTMVDANGQAVSTSAGPVSFTIVAGTTTSAALGFPASSFMGVGATGSLSLSWDIAGQQDPASCASHNVDSIHFRLRDASGTLVGMELMQSCTAFAASVPSPYPVATYTLSGELFLGSTVRTTSASVSVAIAPGTTTQQTVDFPETSFLAP